MRLESFERLIRRVLSRYDDRSRVARALSQRGSIMILYCCTLGFLVLTVGLAIDVGMLYLVNSQLQTAVDGAASGAIRLVSSNANESEIAGEFVRANMPSSYFWNTTPTVTNFTLTSYTQSPAHSTVSVSASVGAPLLFLKYLGMNLGTSGAVGTASTGTATVYNVNPCTLTYPYGSAPSLDSVQFQEYIDLVGWGPTYVFPHGKIMAWYDDEHAMTLGIYKIYVMSTTGTITTYDYTSSWTPYNSTTRTAGTATATLPVGSTALSGDQAATDSAGWSSSYNYQYGRPIWPALFITDLTYNTSNISGDWQQGGTSAIPPNFIYGTWKGAQMCVNYGNNSTTCPMTSCGTAKGQTPCSPQTHAVVSTVLDSDPSQNQWNGIPDTPTGGFPMSSGWGTEVVWYIDSLNLQPGHTYRLQLMVHDGDQNKAGGDSGEGCMIAKI